MSWGTAWVGCWPAGSPSADRTWWPASSPWAARCSRRGAHHRSLAAGVDALVGLSRVGLPGLMSLDCVAGSCAQRSFEESRLPMPDGVSFAAVYSRRDGIVDWRACVDPLATAIEVSASHLGMAIDPRVHDHVVAALRG